MLLLGIDLGTSSVKVAVVNATTGECLASAAYPEAEAAIYAPNPGWAEQDPEQWWRYVEAGILKCHSLNKYDPRQILSIGIAYQMHGLVLVDKERNVLRPSIIWCDGRAVTIGDQAFAEIGEAYCLSHLLNSPGNFTASKLSWVKENEPEVYEKVDKVLLPGDYIAMKLTGECTTTPSALSEGIFWDFKKQELSSAIMGYFGFSTSIIPQVQDVFSEHGRVTKETANKFSFSPGIPVSYKAGDQLNNAFSLKVMRPGDVAASGGTSGVIYGISDELVSDQQSRVNSFVHLNNRHGSIRTGVLLCINGAGNSYSWLKKVLREKRSYHELNKEAAAVDIGCNGLMMLPFGNGPERMLCNKTVGAQFRNLDLNAHTPAHLVRATQEGIAFAFRYGLDIMRSNGLHPSVIKAGMANLFQSQVFVSSFVNATGVPVELYHTDGSIGAAFGSAVNGEEMQEAQDIGFIRPLKVIEPQQQSQYEVLYEEWKVLLKEQLQNILNPVNDQVNL